MQNLVFHFFSRAQKTFSVRQLSTSSPRNGTSYTPSRRLERKIAAFTYRYNGLTRDPVWSLVSRLGRVYKGNALYQSLEKCDVSFFDYLEWKPVVNSSDIDQAMLLIREKKKEAISRQMTDVEESTGALDVIRQSSKIPPWVVIHLVSHKVRTPAQAQDGLVNLVFAHLPIIALDHRPPLLVIAAHSLAAFEVLSPMRRLIYEFLTMPLPHPEFHFNALLRAISEFTSSEEAADLVVSLLDAMSSRNISLRSSTYKSLLSDRFVTLQLTKHLRTRMTQDGFTPKAPHLEEYLRIFSNHGAIHDSQEYLQAIRRYCLEHNLEPPYGPELHSSARNVNAAEVVHPANTLYLGSLRDDRASAFQYLHRLLRSEGQKDASRDKSSKEPELAIRRSITTTFWGGRKKTLDIYDWTTALVSAANDRAITAEALVRLFERAQAKTQVFRPTVVTYTVVLRGLLHRKKFDEALVIWNQLVNSKLTIDRKALTIGLQLLTRAGQAPEAFYLLNTFAGLQDGAIQSDISGTSADDHVLPMININVIVINEFLVSLLRSRRPDIVFQLWDHMEMLYGILPNDSTLNIVMKSAILAMKLDNESVRSTFQHMTLNSLFHRPKPEPTGRTEVISDIMQKLEGRRRSSAVGIWRNAPAWAVARQLFRDVLVGNWPWLQQVPQPATAIRTADAETAAFYPLQEFAQSMSLPFSSPKTPETLEQGGKGQIPLITEAQPDQKLYSSIVPTDVTFTPYIQLLGLSSLAREIPEALAWMRALKIHPSKKTLSIALVFWAEVSLRGPLFEDWAEKNSQSEYGRLLAWIRDWVGDEQTPTEWDIQRALRAVAKMRDDSFGRP